MLRTLALCVLALAATALDIGDAAPSLAGVTWVKGKPVEAKGGITVVEFWATWCGPCKATIPHLTALQAKHGDKIRIAGISNEDKATVEPFVAAQGKGMEYRVGIAGEADYAKWMEGRDGIPFAYLLDASGTVVWAGHPMGLDQPLAQLVAGRLDLAKARQQAGLRKTLEGQLKGQQPDLAGAQRTLAALFAIDPLDRQAVDLSLAIAKYTKDPAAQRRTLERLPLAEMDAAMANGLAWDLAIDPELPRRHLDLALAFIGRALALEPANAAYLDTRARIHYALGQIDEAIAVQRKALAAEPDDEGMKATLAFYESLPALRSGKPAAKPKAEPAPMP